MSSLYNIERSEDGLSYHFITKFNIRYTLALTSCLIGDVNAFSLSLYPESETSQIDYGIKQTVIKIIGDLLNVDSNVILFVCDNDDKREDKRHAVFEYWYQKAEQHFWYITKYNHCFDSDYGYRINSSVLYNNQNPLGDLIVKEFKAMFEV